MESVVVLVLLIAAVSSIFVSWILALFIFVIAISIPIADVFLSIIRAKRPIEIQTPDGSGEPFHPSVVFFEEGWNGFRYWMAFTPYPVCKPPYRDRWECPCVVASNDGIHWEYPGDFAFLDDLTENQIQSRDYFSDTHLTYDSSRNVLYCYYRLDKGEGSKKVTIFRRESAEGKKWSERIPLVYSESVDALEPLSQSVVYENGCFSMWYVAHSGDPNGVYMLISPDGIVWDCNKKCIFSGAAVVPWHIDCQYMDGRYYLTVYELSQRITLWTSSDGLNFTFVKLLLTIPKFGNCGLFYNNILYRACTVKDEKGYSVYFACGNKKRNTIGLMVGEEITGMKIVSASEKNITKMMVFDILSKYSLAERLLLYKIKRIVKR